MVAVAGARDLCRLSHSVYRGSHVQHHGGLLRVLRAAGHARKIQDQLIQQTSRAAAAERMKTEVLTNLSQEIRAPLYAMIGVLELVAAEGRSNQTAALNMVRTSGRRLVATID